eukprot:15080553-Ditylum_brightwellii.AAC.1
MHDNLRAGKALGFSLESGEKQHNDIEGPFKSNLPLLLDLDDFDGTCEKDDYPWFTYALLPTIPSSHHQRCPLGLEHPCIMDAAFHNIVQMNNKESKRHSGLLWMMSPSPDK